MHSTHSCPCIHLCVHTYTHIYTFFQPIICTYLSHVTYKYIPIHSSVHLIIHTCRHTVIHMYIHHLITGTHITIMRKYSCMYIHTMMGFPGGPDDKESACNAADLALIKGMATHSSVLAWRIPWTEEPGGLQSTGSQRHD